MKCPTCGTSNGRTNKFCRGCGTRLDVLAQHDADQHLDAICPPDDIARGEELFEVWQLYSANDLDAALEKVGQIIECNPESASAHSILALIYQRQAEMRLKSGAVTEARGLLNLAIAQYERIVEMNPDSPADREKLAALRSQLSSYEGGASKAKSIGFRRALRAIPTPWFAAAAVFFIMLIVGIMLIPSGGAKEPVRAARRGRSAQAERISTVATANGRPAAPDTANALKVYTFPQPTENRSTVYAPATASAPPPQPHRITMPDQPVKLPSMMANVKIVPEKASSVKKPATDAATPDKPKPEPAQPVAAAGSSDSSSDGRSTLARAIELRNQGRTVDALNAAQRAIQLYQTDIDSGHNPVEAKRGAENARKLVQLWQSEGGSGE